MAEQFQVSQRTIRNDLNSINEILWDHQLKGLELKSGGEIIRDMDFAKIQSLMSEGDFYFYKLSKEERKKISAALLVNSSEYITLSMIAELLYVSRATVINDLDEVKVYIRNGNLEVLSHPNKGLRIEGKESDKRIFLMSLADSRIDGVEHDDVVAKHIMVQAGNKITIQKMNSP